MSAFGRILFKPNYWPLFGTMSLGAFNDNYFRQALIAFISFGALNLSPEEKSVFSSLSTGLMILPFFLFSSLAGQLADKYRKSRLIQIYKASELVFMGLAAYFFMSGQIYALMSMLFFMGLQSTFFGPLKYGLLPEILSEKELVAGNGLVGGVSFLVIVLGTSAGSYLVTLPLGTRVYLPAGLVLIALIGFLFSLKQPLSLKGDPHLKIDPFLWRSTWQIVGSVRKREDLWLSILAISWFWAMGSILLTQIPVMASSAMGANPEVSTFLVTLFAIGVAIGALSVHWLIKGRVSAGLVPVSSLFLTIFMVALALSVQSLPQAAPLSLDLPAFLQSSAHLRVGLFCFLISLAGGLFVVPLTALLQHRAEAFERSRVIAANNIINSLFIVIGNLLVTLLVKIGFGLSEVLWIVAFSALLVTFLTLYFLPDFVLKQIARVILVLLYRPKVKGLSHLEPLLQGPVLVIPNHTSFADVALLVSYFPRRLTFAIDSFWAQVWWVKLYTKFFETIPINPAKPIGARNLVEALAKGQMVVIFPEGRLTSTGGIMKIYDGPGMIAAKSGAPLLSVVFEGLEYTRFGRLRKILHNQPKVQKISMTIFPPVQLESAIEEGESRKEYRQRVCGEIYNLMVESRFKAKNIDLNLWTALLEQAKISGFKRKIIEDQNRKPVSYAKFIRSAKVLGRRLASLSQPGENLGLLLPNGVVLGATLFGLWAGGRVPVMLNYSQGFRPMASALTTAKVKTIISSKKFVELAGLSSLVKELPARVVFLEDLSIGFLAKILGLCWSGKIQDCNSPAAIVFTSGSEGFPKGVVLSHKNILANIGQALSVIELTRDDIIFNAMPAFHAFGLNVGLILPLLSGIRVFNYPNPLHVKVVPELIYDTKATVVVGSDTFAQAWGKNAHPYDFYTVKFMLLGAEKLKPRTLDLYFHKLNLRLFEGYGVTEASPILAISSRMRGKDGSVGHLLPGLEYRLEEVLGTGGGRLLVRGPNIMMGYLKADKPGEILSLVDGWYDTGDIVDIDKDGLVWIKGRFKRFAKISGEMVSLALVEDVAASIWPQRALAVLSLPDENKGEKLVLVTTEPAPVMDELRQAIKAGGLTELSFPKSFFTLPNIPLTSLGKVDMPKLTEAVLKILPTGGKS